MMDNLSNGTVLICKNGHLVTPEYGSDDIPEKFCSKCGDEMINSCLKCGSKIKGTPISRKHPFS
ncbi:MAG: DUF2321 domain-containing protein [Bacteroidetes bacterium]|nr:DUF2321 domain-containing protein [Bacteroidota bacterium]